MSEAQNNIEDVTRRAMGLPVSEQAELLSRLGSHLAGRLGFAITPEFVPGSSAAVLAATNMEPLVRSEDVDELERAIASGLRKPLDHGIFDDNEGR